jgi:Flp pilus assembly pilin Flp
MINNLKFALLTKLVADKSGASAAEYALILAVVGVGILVGLNAFVGEFNGAMTDVIPG